MTAIAVHHTDDAAAALAATNPFLLGDPVRHNVVLTLLHERAWRPEPGRYWWAVADDHVVGVVMQSPVTFLATMTPIRRDAIEPLVRRIAGDAPDLPGINGEAATAAAFAGCWTECRGIGAEPHEGDRIYRLGTLRTPTGVAGDLRPATDDDLDVVTSWTVAFNAETGAGVPATDDEVRGRMAQRIGDGQGWIWCDDSKSVSLGVLSKPVGGAIRVQQVYTPPEHRRRGYAGASVAAVSERALARPGVDECILYTQLSNPTSNRVYRAIGYEAVAEVLAYHFAPSSDGT
jgi:ribosomal protein S18 acetylase RimI-like enzyme